MCDEYGFYLIEDCVEVIGIVVNGKKVGIFGDVLMFSFFGNKIIILGEGGMVVLNLDIIIDKCLCLKN